MPPGLSAWRSCGPRTSTSSRRAAKKWMKSYGPSPGCCSTLTSFGNCSRYSAGAFRISARAPGLSSSFWAMGLVEGAGRSAMCDELIALDSPPTPREAQDVVGPDPFGGQNLAFGFAAAQGVLADTTIAADDP